MKKFLLYLGIIGSLPIGGMCSLKQSRLLLGPACKSTKESLQKIYQPISLKEQCLMAITQNWHVVLKKSTLTADKVFELLEAHDLFEQFESYLVQAKEGNLPCPELIARDADVAMYAKENYFFISDFACSKKLLEIYNFSLIFPRISHDGMFLIGGWQRGIFCADIRNNTHKVYSVSEKLEPGALHYGFLSNERMMFRSQDALFVGAIADLYKNGLESFQRVYSRPDGRVYPWTTTASGLAVLSPSKVVVCVDINDGFEIMEEHDTQWVRTAVWAAAKEVIWAYQVAPARQLICMIESNDYNTIQFYDARKTDLLCSASSITISHLASRHGSFSGAFSPDETMLICGKEFGEIDIIDCNNLEKPFIAATVRVDSLPITKVIWNDFGACVGDCNNMRYDIHLSPALPHIAAYKKKKREEAQKHTSTLSNNNNA